MRLSIVARSPWAYASYARRTRLTLSLVMDLASLAGAGCTLRQGAEAPGEGGGARGAAGPRSARHRGAYSKRAGWRGPLDDFPVRGKRGGQAQPNRVTT